MGGGEGDGGGEEGGPAEGGADARGGREEASHEAVLVVGRLLGIGRGGFGRAIETGRAGPGPSRTSQVRTKKIKCWQHNRDAKTFCCAERK